MIRDDGVRPHTSNVEWGAPAELVVDDLLAEPFGNWHVTSTAETLQLRVTKRGDAQLHRAAVSVATAPTAAAAGTHDRAPAHLLDPGDPIFDVIGGGAAKRRQVDAFLRALRATLGDSELPDQLRVVDLGCGNAYLTFAAYRYLSDLHSPGRDLDVRITGVDVRADQRERNNALAQRLGWADRVTFVAGTIARAEVETAPDVVLALHACDTATDDALARAVSWGSRWVLAAPCCHHEIAKQLRWGASASGGLAAHGLLRDGILRQRFADVLTDSLRAALLRSVGYRVEVVEFIDSAHTPRNVMLRAVRGTTDREVPVGRDEEYRALSAAWGVTPTLAHLLAPQRPTLSG